MLNDQGKLYAIITIISIIIIIFNIIALKNPPPSQDIAVPILEETTVIIMTIIMIIYGCKTYIEYVNQEYLKSEYKKIKKVFLVKK